MFFGSRHHFMYLTVPPSLSASSLNANEYQIRALNCGIEINVA